MDRPCGSPEVVTYSCTNGPSGALKMNPSVARVTTSGRRSSWSRFDFAPAGYQAGDSVIRSAVGMDGQGTLAVIHAGKRLGNHLAHFRGGHIAQQEEPAGE